MTRSINEFNRDLSTTTNRMKQEVSGNAALDSAVEKLTGKLDQYDAVVKKMATATRTAIKVAAKSAGLPI
jgi:hypothetical protein